MTEIERRYAARRQLWEQAFAGIAVEGKDVLDAGTGEGHFTRFLAELGPGRLTSVTCLESEIGPARARLGALADRVDFRVADLTRLSEFPDRSFDAIGADYLIAAVAAYSPFREIECLRELHRLLRPGGRLIVTGWEVWPERRSPLEARMRSAFTLRDAITLLAGRSLFREHPRFWIEARLAELGMPAERACVVPDVHRDLAWLFMQCEGYLEDLEPAELRQALARKLDLAKTEIVGAPEFAVGVEFGRLYAVIACNLVGGTLLPATDH